jgi:hypothetical protein
LHGRLVRLCKGKNTSRTAYRIFGRASNVERLTLAVCRIKVGLPEGGDIPSEHLHDPLEVG